MRKVKSQKQQRWLTVGGLSALIVTAFSVGLTLTFNSVAARAPSYSLHSQASATPVSPQTATTNKISVPTVDDTHGTTLVFGTNYVRLNQKVAYDTTKNELSVVSLLGVYDGLGTPLQQIELRAGYTRLSAINANDATAGFVVSGLDQTKALYYPVDVAKRQLNVAGAVSVDVPSNAQTVGANFNYLTAATNTNVATTTTVNEPVVVSATTSQTGANNPEINVSIIPLEKDQTTKITQIKTAVAAQFDAIKVVDSFAADNSLYLGVNLLANNTVVGSQLLLIRDGAFISGGPSFTLPFGLNALGYDQTNKTLYAQYDDAADHVFRMWGYDTARPDVFAQLESQPKTNPDSDMVVIRDYGVAALNKTKGEVNAYAFVAGSLVNAPNFAIPTAAYQNNFMRTNPQKLSDLVYNPNTKQFALFYAYDAYVDGVVTWSDLKANKTTERFYTNAAPLHVDYEVVANAMKQQTGWSDVYASVYANKLAKNNYAPLVIIPDYYAAQSKQAQLNNQQAFNFAVNANDNAGTFNLTVHTNPSNTQKDGGSQTLLDYTFKGYLQVDPSALQATYATVPEIVQKSPSELQAALSDPATAVATKNDIFMMFGINKQYAQLPYDVKINGYNVFGQTDIQLSFPTLTKTNLSNTKTNGAVVNQAATSSLTATNTSNNLMFANRFNLAMERWFIPTVTVFAVVAATALLITMWFTWGKKVYARYATKVKQKLEQEYEALHILAQDGINSEQEMNKNPVAFANTATINEHADVKARFREEAPYLNRRQHDRTYDRAVKNRPLAGFHERLVNDDLSWAPWMALTHPINE